MKTRRVKLNELAEWGSGGTPLASRSEYYGGDIPWLIIEDLNDGLVTKAARTITKAGLENSSAKIVPPGTLLIAMYGSIGKLGITNMECATNQAIAFCKCDSTQVDTRFLFSLLLNQRAKFIHAGRGGTQQNISQEFLKEYEILLPDLSEQRQIAGRLEQADRLRRTRRYTLELTDTFLPATFRELFGDVRANTKQWDSVTLGEMLVRGPQNGLYKPASSYGSGTPILRIDAFYDGVVTDIRSLKRVRIRPDEIQSFGLTEDDIVINRVNSRPYLGKSALIPRLNEPTVFESNMMRLTLNTGSAVPTYVTHYLQTLFVKSQIQVLSRDAVNQSSINQEDAKGLTMRLPPIPLQQKFAALVERVERLRAAQREALRQAEHLFTSLLHRTFRAETL